MSIALYESRDQKAVEETKNIYGRLIRSIITNVVGNGEDAGECENDTYMALWNSIPPQHPQALSAYISRIAKNIAINCLRDSKRQKRSAEQVALEELVYAFAEGADLVFVRGPRGICPAEEQPDLSDGYAKLSLFLPMISEEYYDEFLGRYGTMQEQLSALITGRGM